MIRQGEREKVEDMMMDDLRLRKRIEEKWKRRLEIVVENKRKEMRKMRKYEAERKRIRIRRKGKECCSIAEGRGGGGNVIKEGRR